ncbi:MAG: cyclodeaminase/cyclohydrolase family protein [Deltaproteobacteria bacterium]|nr:cyclodeaminase/cyclohydrolase family protein [Deltaproteobacteria bacterium]
MLSKSVLEFLDDVSSGSPVPGGGSVAAIAGALGTSLISMVLNLTASNKKYEEFHQFANDNQIEVSRISDRLKKLVVEDAEAFDKVMSAFKMPKNTDEEKSERKKAIEEATKQAIAVPLETGKQCIEGLSIINKIIDKSNKNAISDLGVANLLLKAACEGALYNVYINLSSISDRSYCDEIKKVVDKMITRKDELFLENQKRIENLLGITG